jgi:sulfate transport system ATP-binding protein
VPSFTVGAGLRLRLMQFSVYPRSERVATPPRVEAPVLIGRERERGVSG